MNYTSKSFEFIKNWLKEELSEEKYIHSFGVMEYAENLAKRFNLNAEKAKVAGLLHDCAKSFNKKLMFEIIKFKKISVFEKEKEHLKTLHAPISAFIAMSEFGVKDEEIINAIRYHTIARVNMTNFEKIVFVADKIELNTREKELTTEVESLLIQENGLNKAMEFLLKRTINHLRTKEKPIDEYTLAVFEYFFEAAK